MPTAASSAASSADSAWVDTGLEPTDSPAAQARRQQHLRVVMLLGLVAAALLVLWWHWLANSPALSLTVRADTDGTLVLIAAGDAAAQPALGGRVSSLGVPGQMRLALTTELMPTSPRWEPSDVARAQQLATRTALAELLQQPNLTLDMANGLQIPLQPAPRGLLGLGLVCWALGALALLLFGAGVVVVLDKPSVSNALYATLTVVQAAQLLLIGADWLPGWGLPPALMQWGLVLHLLCDLALGLGLLLLVRRRPADGLRPARWPVLAAAAAVLALLGAAALAAPIGLWWWAQALQLGLGIWVFGLMRQRLREQAHPVAIWQLRLTAAGYSTLALLTLAVALASTQGQASAGLVAVGGTLWQLFATMLLLLAPFLSRTRRTTRELALLTGVGTVACSLELVFITVLGISHAAAITLALAVAMLAYLTVRHWALRQLADAGGLSAERMFESLYRAARELEQAPEQVGEQLTTLLREVFDPLELSRSDRTAPQARLAKDGSALLVPVPQLNPGEAPAGGLVLRFAHRGRRLFTADDLRLAVRITEQLRRAVAYDRAVEHGRHEERTRIAQDLHDDIGARLLTLMYKAADPEIEGYIRHTLQDLKTLTRGLAASHHPLSHAAAEWKADIAQRLAATGCELRWSFSCDRELTLTMVQWSGLTRVLRELINNVLSHANASQVEVMLQVERRQVLLLVCDDGQGRAPQAWSHGLGLGGVRKRVKLLGGDVQWSERQPRGIRCEVRAWLSHDRAPSRP